MKANGICLPDFIGLGETDCTLGGHKQNLAPIKAQRKGTMTPQDTEPDLLVLEGLLWRSGLAVVQSRDGDNGSNSLGRCPFM